MNRHRILAVFFVMLFVGSGWVGLSAQKDQPKRSKQEQQDIDTLVKLVDSVIMGQPGPTDVPVVWESTHFVKGGDGATYVPFSLSIDRSKLSRPNASLYVRVATKEQVAAASAKKDGKQAKVIYPVEHIYFPELKADGKIARAVALPPGEYEVFVAVKDKATDQKNQPAAKVGLLRHDLTVPDYSKAELTTSSLILASAIEPLQTPPTAEQQQENPYILGGYRVVPTMEKKFSKTGRLPFMYYVYGASQDANRKPDVQLDYSFYQKNAEGEKYFNKTAPMLMNAQTLPPQFDMGAGHQLQEVQEIPLASFPVGDYRLEIKVTDKPSGKVFTQNLEFAVTE